MCQRNDPVRAGFQMVYGCGNESYGLAEQYVCGFHSEPLDPLPEEPKPGHGAPSSGKPLSAGQANIKYYGKYPHP